MKKSIVFVFGIIYSLIFHYSKINYNWQWSLLIYSEIPLGVKEVLVSIYTKQMPSKKSCSCRAGAWLVERHSSWDRFKVGSHVVNGANLLNLSNKVNLNVLHLIYGIMLCLRWKCHQLIIRSLHCLSPACWLMIMFSLFRDFPCAEASIYVQESLSRN